MGLAEFQGEVDYTGTYEYASWDGLFLKEGNPSTPHELNKAIGRNFHFMV